MRAHLAPFCLHRVPDCVPTLHTLSYACMVLTIHVRVGSHCLACVSMCPGTHLAFQCVQTLTCPLCLGGQLWGPLLVSTCLKLSAAAEVHCHVWSLPLSPGRPGLPVPSSQPYLTRSLACKVPGAWRCSVLPFLPRMIFLPAPLPPSPATPPRPRMRPHPGPARPVTSASSLPSQRLPRTVLVSAHWCLPEQVSSLGGGFYKVVGGEGGRRLDASPSIASILFMTLSWMLPHSGPWFLLVFVGKVGKLRPGLTQGLQPSALERQALEPERLGFEASLGHWPAV